MKRYVGLLLIAALWTISSPAAEVSVSGGWWLGLGPFDLTGGAGSDLRSPLESAGDQVTVHIDQTGDAAWTLRVRRGTGNLPSGVSLAARLSHPGNGSGSVSGGGYVTLDPFDQVLATGEGDRSDMRVQLRLSGHSVRNLSPGSYDATIIYSVE